MLEQGLLTVNDLSPGEWRELFEICQKPLSDRPALNRTGLSLFGELSTRTKLSFEKAALDEGGRLLDWDWSRSSLQKGETLAQSFEVIAEYQFDFFLIRHSDENAAALLSQKTGRPVFNAGGGQKDHPTQAAADAFVLWARDPKRSWRIAFYGDGAYSRVFRSSATLFQKLGWSVAIHSDRECEGFENVRREDLRDFDVVYALRTQKERGSECGLSPLRREDLSERSLLMHAGPVILGQDLEAKLLEERREYCLIQDQVRRAYRLRREILRICFS